MDLTETEREVMRILASQDKARAGWWIGRHRVVHPCGDLALAELEKMGYVEQGASARDNRGPRMWWLTDAGRRRWAEETS